MSTLKRVTRVVLATLLTAGIFAGTAAATDAAVAKSGGGISAHTTDTGW